MFEWLKEKIKKLDSIVDFGILLSMFSALMLFMIYIYKLTVLNILSIPINIALSFIDIDSIDIITATVFSFVFIIAELLFYFAIYKVKKAKKFFHTFILVVLITVICKIAGFNTYNIILINAGLLLWIYLGLTLFTVTIFRHPKNIIANIFHTESEKTKILVFFTECLTILLNLIILSMLIANLYTMLPMNRLVADNQFVLYSSQEQHLVANYQIINHTLVYDSDTLKMISKDGTALTETDRLPIRQNK